MEEEEELQGWEQNIQGRIRRWSDPQSVTVAKLTFLSVLRVLLQDRSKSVNTVPDTDVLQYLSGWYYYEMLASGSSFTSPSVLSSCR